VFLVFGLIVGLGMLLVVQGVVAKPLRPAATGPSPEEAQLKQFPASVQQVGRPSKADLLARCQQRPVCRAKIEGAQKGKKPATVRPAATTSSPEELELKKIPAPVTPVTPRRFQRSGIDMRPLDSLLAWLNPFRPPVAEAQSAVSVYLAPQNPIVSSPYSLVYLCGVNSYYGIKTLYSGNSTPSPSAENKPYVYTYFTAPASSWYIIDFRTSHSAAKLRHQTSGPIIETWDLGSVPVLAGYVTT
jgi:hypothetical protein